jgi:two-component system chemotaxis response regulator CheY
MRVLIAEDELGCRLVLQRYLHDVGHTDVAVNGLEAVESFRLALATGEPYDLVLLDIEMPEMDGQEALKAMRQVENDFAVGKEGEARIFIITAHADQRNVCDAFFKGGATGYLVKPVERRVLLSTLGMEGADRQTP